MSEPADAAIAIASLRKVYGDTVAVDDVSLQVKRWNDDPRDSPPRMTWRDPSPRPTEPAIGYRDRTTGVWACWLRKHSHVPPGARPADLRYTRK